VTSADRALGAARTRESRFAISMFAYGEPDSSVTSERVEDGVYRPLRLEEQAQGLLDWLFAHHPDYWRLNDFSEAFSILRWIKGSGASVTILDMHGEAPTLLTSDQIFHGVAEPKIGP
jgi:hypothetical protein